MQRAVKNICLSIADQFRQFRAVSIEEEEENDQENTLSSSQVIKQLNAFKFLGANLSDKLIFATFYFYLFHYKRT